MSDSLAERIKRAAEVLKSYGAEEVYVFGSAVTGDLRRDSDVDMAVTDLETGTFFRAMGDAADVVGRPVDLVDLSKPTALARYLKRSGGLKRVG